MTRRHGSVLVPTDFSAGAELALERALRLPLARRASVVVLHVLPPDAPRDVVANTDQRLAAIVDTVARRTDLEVTSEVAIGIPYEQIIVRSRARGTDLIVMGRHGRRAVRDLFIGSTASRTLRYGDAPVLVVSGDVTAPYRRPLVATGLDEVAPRVAELALSVLDPGVERVDIVHAYHVPFEDLYEVTAAQRLECEHAAGEAMNKLLGALRMERARWCPVLRCGDARSIILSEITARRSDLVVLGTHGRSGLAHAIIGSVAEYVIGAAPCDVLVTRPAHFTFAMP